MRVARLKPRGLKPTPHGLKFTLSRAMRDFWNAAPEA
jgi:hypothetical protein